MLTGRQGPLTRARIGLAFMLCTPQPHTPMKKSTTLAATALLVSACSHPPTPSPAPAGAPPKVGMANPASVFCIQQGGKLRMVKTALGEHAMCVLPDGREIEEWAFFRQHHTN
jgi:putative hemolysin